MTALPAHQHTASASEPLMGLASLMSLAFRGADLGPLGEQLLARADHDGGHGDANALLDLSTLLQIRKLPDIALSVQAQALQTAQHYQLPATKAEKLRLLAIMSPGDLMANTPLEFLVQNSDIALDMLYVTAERPLPSVLPPHDLVFIAACESDANRKLLQQLVIFSRYSKKPVLNLPQRIPLTGRNQAYRLLGSEHSILMPATARIERLTAEKIAAGELAVSQALPGLTGSSFPLIIRPVDSHAGNGLRKLTSTADLSDYLSNMAEDEFCLSPFIDYRSQDGQFRKYRVVLIGGQPYAAHMGISTDWMIHYLNAGMEESAAKREEEAAFMASFDDNFAVRHADAFAAINRSLQLDYLVIDCAETADGKLLIFELDTGAVVHDMDAPELFPYKPQQMASVFAAFRQLLLTASGKITPA